jgi:RHS repeat-associated protein
VVNGDRKSLNAGNGGAWVDAGPANSFPDWVQVDFGTNKTLDEIDVFTLQDNYAGSSEPTESMTFTQWGLTAYQVQYWDGTNWTNVPGGSITGNNKIWRRFTFSAITTSKIRVLTNASPDGFSRLTEIEAYAPADSGASNGVQWLITDHLGSPRMILDQTGSLANIKRKDYLPYGEELVAPTSGRNAAQGYSGGDDVRQQFTAQERDTETGLDYFGARYYASLQGRFSGADPKPVTKENFLNPQRWNLYTYVNNNPLCAVDPDGGQGQGKGGDKTISVFLDLGTEVGTRVTTYTNPTEVVKEPNASDWQGAKTAAARKDYNLDLQGNPTLTGEKGPPDVITNRDFEESLAKSEVTIYIGHGVQEGRDALQIPFKQHGIKVGLTEYTASGTGNPSISVPPFTGPKPEVTASVVANFSCDSDSTGSSYFNFVGKNQYMVTVNSGKDGATSADAIEQAANAFVKTYVATGGNVQKAVDAANAALAKNPGESNQNVGDRIVVKPVN